jgi:Bacterial capsule synthesis protein PGA_cap
MVTRPSTIRWGGGIGVLALFAAGLVTACAHSSATIATARTTTAPKHPAPKARAATRDTSFTLVAGGDIALNGSGANASTFSGIERFLHGDLVFGNLEGVLAVDGSAKCAPYGSDGCFTFRADPSSARFLRSAGFTIMNIANNHAMDYGPGAQSETINALRAANLDYDGLPGQIEAVDAGGVKVAFIGAAPYPWAQSLLDIAGTAALVRKARSEADVVIVYMHAGAEGSSADHVPHGPETFLGEQRGDPRAFAHAMIDAGAGLVIASGPHTLRGLEWYHDHLIAYSLGNLAGSNTLATDGSLSLSALLSVRLGSDGRLLDGRVIPVRLVGPGTPVYDSTGASVSLVRTLSEEDFPGSRLQIGSDGSITVAGSRRARK